MLSVMEQCSGGSNLAQAAYEHVKACICDDKFPMGAAVTPAISSG
jgi:hypothetical protein